MFTLSNKVLSTQLTTTIRSINGTCNLLNCTQISLIPKFRQQSTITAAAPAAEKQQEQAAQGSPQIGSKRSTVASAFEAAIQNVRPDHNARTLHIRWADGEKGEFPYVWLRDCAPAPRTIEQVGRESRRIFTLTDLSLDVVPEKVELCPEGVRISWPPYYSVIYPSGWLKKYQSNVEEFDVIDRGVKRTAWGRAEMQNSIPTVKLGDLRARDEHRESMWKQFLQVGLLIISGAKPEEFKNQDVEVEILKLFGFDPVNTEDRNVYTHHPTGLCTGMPLCEDPPRACLLSFPGAPGGGTVQLVDGLNVAEQIQDTHKSIFRYLCEVPVEYKSGDTDDTTSHPVLTVTPDDRLERVVFNNELRSFRVALPARKIAKFYAALKTFNGYCYQSRNLVNHRPQQGDLILVHNHRVLHGATAFDHQEKGSMHVVYGK